MASRIGTDGYHMAVLQAEDLIFRFAEVSSSIAQAQTVITRATFRPSSNDCESDDSGCGQIYEELLEKFPGSSSLLAEYAHFCDNILNDEAKAEKHRERAALLENASGMRASACLSYSPASWNETPDTAHSRGQI